MLLIQRDSREIVFWNTKCIYKKYRNSTRKDYCQYSRTWMLDVSQGFPFFSVVQECQQVHTAMQSSHTTLFTIHLEYNLASFLRLLFRSVQLPFVLTAFRFPLFPQGRTGMCLGIFRVRFICVPAIIWYLSPPTLSFSSVSSPRYFHAPHPSDI